jgi:hypothetical protein
MLLGVVQCVLEEAVHIAASRADGEAATPRVEPDVPAICAKRSAACDKASTTTRGRPSAFVLTAALSWSSVISGNGGG